ncbi:hypothetical protein [Thiorhodovibrio frisius]|nr:hypothetical protein [Thiorhodovibrio frisius]
MNIVISWRVPRRWRERVFPFCEAELVLAGWRVYDNSGCFPGTACWKPLPSTSSRHPNRIHYILDKIANDEGLKDLRVAFLIDEAPSLARRQHGHRHPHALS